MKRLWISLAILMGACHPTHEESGATPPSPAQVENAVPEKALATVTLTPEAQQRLGIETGMIERRDVQRMRLLGGEVVVPPGSSVVVSAPVSGRLASAPEPRKGFTVKEGETLILLHPILAQESRAQLSASAATAAASVAPARARLEAAQIVRDRAERLMSEGAGRERDVDDSRARVAEAEALLAAAEAQKTAFEEALSELGSGTSAPIAIRSPVDGLLMKVNVGPGQLVPMGAALYEIVDPERLWVRVPVWVGDLPRLDLETEIRVASLSASPSHGGQPARPVTAPPTADPRTSSLDIYYALEGAASSSRRPGERVAARVPERTVKESLVVAWSAVLFDAQGGAWVYEVMKERVYTRRRIEVAQVIDGVALLTRGPRPGTPVVTQGALEIFGTEFPTWK